MFDEDALFAAAARAKHKVEYDSCLPDFPGISDYERATLMAYDRFVESTRAAAGCTQIRYAMGYNLTHKCDELCRRAVFYENYAFCVKSGHLHICDTERCDERRDNAGEEVCLFTGKRFGAHFDLDLQDRAGSREQFSRVVSATPKLKVFGPKPKRFKSKTGIKGRKITAATREKQNDQSKLYADARNQLLSLLSECEEDISTTMADRFATTCVIMWVKLKEPAEHLQRAIKYHFNYHCVVVAYTMINGMDVEDVTLLCANDFFAEHLPDMKRFKDFGVTTAWHTKCTKQFLLALRSLTHEELLVMSLQLRKYWM